MQVNGKLRATISVVPDEAEDVIRNAALAEPAVQRAIADKEIRKFIVVKNRVVNIVV